MKSSQKGFSIVEILIVAVVVGLLGAVGWLVYDRQKSKTDDKSAIQTTQEQKKEFVQQEAKTADLYEGWKEVTFTPENIKIKLPASIKTASTVALNTDGTGTVIDLEKGYSLYVSLLGNSKTDNSYGNTEKSTAYDSFTFGSQKYYITNSGISLDVSTCQAQVCALQSKLGSEKSILVQV
jgi:prepilin-type N-terminal cleavage/methylation domain-containing protein